MNTEHQKVAPQDGPKSLGPYSPAIISKDMVFVSGQVDRNPSTNRPSGVSIEAQRRQALKNITSILQASGCEISDVVKTTAFLIKPDHFQCFNKVYSEFFQEPYPVRSMMVSALVLEGYLDEVGVIIRRRG